MGDRKMLTCFHCPGGAAPGSGSPARTTRPSAGETTSATAASVGRSGSRKKKRKAPDRTRKGTDHAGCAASATSRARTSAPRTNGHPAGSMRMPDHCKGVHSKGPARGPCHAGGRPAPGHQLRSHLAALAQHVLHLVFDLQLLFFQLHFFELFGVREEGAGGKVVQAIVQVVVLQSQLAKLLIRLEEELA